MARRGGLLRALAALVAGTALLQGAGRAEEPTPSSLPWLWDGGTAVLGLALLRVAPATAGVEGRLRLRYEERPTDYAAFDAVQAMALPGDAFAAEGRCFADRCLAFARSAAGTYRVDLDVPVAAAGLLLVGFGPFEGPDTGRPLTLDRVYSLDAVEATGVAWRFVDAEAGELNVKSWTNRPEVRRGGPVRDPAAGRDHWFEARPQVFYDPERVRAPGDPETTATADRRREAESLRARARTLARAGQADGAAELEAEAAALLAAVEASDERVPLPAPLAERLRRTPLRWR